MFFFVSSSDILVKERQLSQDLVQSSKKDQAFRSIFQHVQTPQYHRSPSEIFAEHVVAILHHVKGKTSDTCETKTLSYLNINTRHKKYIIGFVNQKSP